MSTEQRQNLEAILGQSACPADSDVDEQQRQLQDLLSAQPRPTEMTVTAATPGVPTAVITVDGIEPRHIVLYFHGGVCASGDAFLAADLASQVGRRTHAKVFSVDYRLAPEHPYPAAVDDTPAAYEALLQDGTRPSGIAFAGESADGGFAIATLVNARDRGLPMPAAAFVMQPYAGLTRAGETMETKREGRPADERMIIDVGPHEVLLDEAVAALDRAGRPRVGPSLRRSSRHRPPPTAHRPAQGRTHSVPTARFSQHITRLVNDRSSR